MREAFDFIKEFPVPIIISLLGTIWFHKSIVNAYELSTANPVRMGQLYFIVFAGIFITTAGVQVFIEKQKRK
jgi:hypothetical protein